jgi:AraC-like DNA-binding protein
MKRCDAFGRDPIGTYVAGRTFVVWCAAPDLIGSFQWGSPDEAEVRASLHHMDVIRHPRLAPASAVLMDNRGIERVDADVLLTFVALARDWLPRWAPRISRQAVIVPDGLRGLLLAGALPVLGPTFPFQFTATIEGALDFLAHPAADDAHAAMAAATSAQRATDTLIVRLRAVVERDLRGITLGSAARQLGISERTLQRELGAHGTSFSDEVRRTRVTAAVELLRLDRETKTETIARQVGFGTSSRLAAALRRELDTTAAALRPAR